MDELVVNDKDAAAHNSEAVSAALEAGETVVLPKGDFWINKAFGVHAGAGGRLFGQGDKSMVRCAGWSSLFEVVPAGQGWRWPFTPSALDRSVGVTAFENPNLKPGNTVWVSRAEGAYHTDGQGMMCESRLVMEVLKKDDLWLCRLNLPLRAEHNEVKAHQWAWPVRPGRVCRGADFVDLDVAPSGPFWPVVGQTYRVSAGPLLANEDYGEDVLVVEVAGSRVWFNRRLSQAYPKDVLLAQTGHVVNLTFTDVHAVLTDNWYAGYWKGCVNLKAQGCDLPGILNIGTSTKVELDECHGHVECNTATDVLLTGCTFKGGLAFEEGCSDCVVDDSTVLTATQNGVRQAQSQFLTLRRVDVKRVGNSALSLSGPDTTLADVTCEHSEPNYVDGDRLRSTNLRTGGMVYFHNGFDQYVAGGSLGFASYGIENSKPSTGTSVRVTGGRQVAAHARWRFID